MTLRARLRYWKLYFGLARETNPHVGRGPTHEDLARERGQSPAQPSDPGQTS